jgi:hypothetical protein
MAVVRLVKAQGTLSAKTSGPTIALRIAQHVMATDRCSEKKMDRVRVLESKNVTRPKRRPRPRPQLSN